MAQSVCVKRSLTEEGGTEIILRTSGHKKMRINIELEDDCDDEFDTWLKEPVLEAVGLNIRIVWMHELNMKRITDGEYVRVCIPLRQHPDRFFQYYRMSVKTYDYILKSIENNIQKYSRRPSISPGERCNSHYQINK